MLRFAAGALDLGVQPKRTGKETQKETDNLFLRNHPWIWKPNDGSFYHSYQYVVEIRICGGRDPLFSFSSDLVWSCSLLALTSFDLTIFFWKIDFFAGRCCRLLDKHWLPLKKRLLSQHTYMPHGRAKFVKPAINQIEKIVKMTDPSYAFNSLTKFRYKISMTGSRN